jgi:voltage-gated potassium channel
MPGGDGPARTGGSRGRHPLLMAILRSLLTVSGVLVLYLVLPLDREFSALTLAVLGAGVVAMGLLVAWQVRAILHSSHPALRAVEAVAVSIPLFLLLFAGTYAVLSGSDPGAFTEPLSRVDGLYFVVTVFATVGFGDISAVSQVARLLVTVQMVGDLVLIGLVLRVFLTAVDRGRRRAAGQEDPPAAVTEGVTHPAGGSSPRGTPRR